MTNKGRTRPRSRKRAKKIVVSSVAIGCLLLLLPTIASQAGIFRESGAVRVIDPLDVVFLVEGLLEGRRVYAIAEDSECFLRKKQRVDAIRGFDTNQRYRKGRLRKNLCVNSYLLHFDPPGATPLEFLGVRFAVYFEGFGGFEEEILGLIFSNKNLTKSEKKNRLGLPLTVYLNNDIRGLELQLEDENIRDRVSWRGNYLEAYVAADSGIDEIRVLTECESRPGPDDYCDGKPVHSKGSGSGHMVDVVIEPGEVGCGDRTFAVTILSTEHFDAWQVDPASVRFGPAGAGVEHRSRYPEDVDGDGDLDMVLHFQAAATGLTASADQGWVTARTFLGVEITGTDSLSSSVKELLSVHCVS